MNRRILHLWFPQLETDWLQRYRPHLAGLPLVTTKSEGGRIVIVCVNELARQQGVEACMNLADARALMPSLWVTDHSSMLITKVLNSMADWCDRYTPYVSLCGADGLWLDITGCSHLYGGEAALLDHVLRSFGSFCYIVRGSIADTPGIAWAASRYTEGGVVMQGAGKALLASLPPTSLRCSYATTEVLRRLGLRVVGDLYNIPRAAITRRFGKEICRALDLALGEIQEPISPRKYVSPYIERFEFIEPVIHQEAIERALDELLQVLCSRLEETQRGVRQLELSCYKVDGDVAKTVVGTGQPTVSAKHLHKLFTEKLKSIDAGLGIELATLSAIKTEVVSSQDLHMLDTASCTRIQTAEVLDHIAGRLGNGATCQQYAVESHNPLRAAAYRAPLQKHDIEFMALERPTRLLRYPEHITVIARVPDDPPMQFTWRGTSYRVRHAHGPERIEGEWWRGAQEMRDYYNVEDMSGCRYWIYRSGHYQAELAANWYIHGLFG